MMHALLLTILASPTITEAVKDKNGFLLHTVESEFQKGQTQIRVLLPGKMEKDRRYPVVYVLPVEAGVESRYGDGLLEVKKLGSADKHGAIFVAPTFSHLPWYADHPTDATIRQETYFIKVVLPFVEKQYPAINEAKGRHVLGFSKSGWGAWSLLLRHPDQFAKAVAWDAPLMEDKPARFGMGPIFGDQANFEKYQITKLLEIRGKDLGSEKRLILLGVGGFKDQHEKMKTMLENMKIPHHYTDKPLRKHDWHSGWVEEGVAALFEGVRKDR